jgi:uncharacterized damage-inducible protein DinB
MTAAATPLSIPAVDGTAKARLLRKFEREHATTLKILRAFPADQASLRPNERCNSAQQLAGTFVVEETMLLKSLKGEQVLGAGFPTVPDSWDEIVEEFERTGQAVIAELQSPTDANLAGTTTFFVAPKQTGDIPREAFADFMIHDQIHHRGQLSIYVRLAGAKLPSIYGPTADEPWH